MGGEQGNLYGARNILSKAQGCHAAFVKKRADSRVQLYGEGYRAVVERVASNVRRLREARGWTQEEAAFRCAELDPTVFRVVEAARSNITAVTLARLAAGFGVDVRDLFDPAPPLVKRKRGRPTKRAEVTTSAPMPGEGDPARED